MGFCLLTERTAAIESEILVTVTNENNLLNDTSIQSPSPPMEMAMNWAYHFSVVTSCENRYRYNVIYIQVILTERAISCYTT